MSSLTELNQPDTRAIPAVTNKNRLRMPWPQVILFGAVAFTICFIEAMPVGLLSQMSIGLGVSEALTGQLVSALAFTAAITAIPLTMLLERFSRRPLLIAVLLGFAAVNVAITFAPGIWLIIGVRIVNGALLGVLWSMLPGYVIKIVPKERIGQGLAVVTIGVSAAFAFGPPISSFLGDVLGWRAVWMIGAVIALSLAIAVRLVLPSVAGAPKAVSGSERHTLLGALLIPGLLPALAATGAFMLGHYLGFTYIIPVMRGAGITEHTDLVLLAFGAASLVGVWITASIIDRRFRLLALLSTGVTAAAVVALAATVSMPAVLGAAAFVAIVLWGLAYGGAPTVFQAGVSFVADGPQLNTAQSILVTVWNTAIALGALLGGALLDGAGVPALLWCSGGLLVVSALVVTLGRRHSFTR